MVEGEGGEGGEGEVPEEVEDGDQWREIHSKRIM